MLSVGINVCFVPLEDIEERALCPPEADLRIPFSRFSFCAYASIKEDLLDAHG